MGAEEKALLIHSHVTHFFRPVIQTDDLGPHSCPRGSLYGAGFGAQVNHPQAPDLHRTDRRKTQPSLLVLDRKKPFLDCIFPQSSHAVKPNYAHMKMPNTHACANVY